MLAVHDYTKSHPYAPSVRELAEICGFSSTSVCFYWLTKLQRKGFVDWVTMGYRTIHIPEGVTMREWYDGGIRHVEVEG